MVTTLRWGHSPRCQQMLRLSSRWAPVERFCRSWGTRSANAQDRHELGFEAAAAWTAYCAIIAGVHVVDTLPWAMQVQSVLASVDVQEFNLKALMKQLGARCAQLTTPPAVDAGG